MNPRLHTHIPVEYNQVDPHSQHPKAVLDSRNHPHQDLSCFLHHLHLERHNRVLY